MYHPTCYDRDSCGFFFDGYLIELLVTSDAIAGDPGILDNNYAYGCTMPLSEDQSDMFNDVLVTEKGYFPTTDSAWNDIVDE